MLKALELAGFKSFADRTRFEFPDGITVVVGPNGSGKSNVVDAIKWVLGTQSPKSLRGKDMSDVIFKGSQTRSPAGSAEVTIFFDNEDGALGVDSPEVRLTRRVFRSGDAEYLINGAAVRLKDIKDLIRGTGIGIDAYSLIEQGKVDRMLQAGPKDRRAIFEEAAGISKFKAKKVEAERRLARVQSNLTRLGDIVDELGTRLKSLRAQAGRAEKFRQVSHQLRESRVTLAWAEWISFSDKIDRLQRDHSEALRLKKHWEERRDSLSEQRQSADAAIDERNKSIEAVRNRWSEHTSEIAETSGRDRADRDSVEQIRQRIVELRVNGRELLKQKSQIDAEIKNLDGEKQTAIRSLQSIEAKAEDARIRHTEANEEAENLKRKRDALNRDLIAAQRRVAELENERSAKTVSAAEALRSIEKLHERVANNENRRIQAEEEASAAIIEEQRISEEVDNAQREVESAVAALAESQRIAKRRENDLSELRIQFRGATERAEVFRELESRQEGLSLGVREVLAQVQSMEDKSLRDGVVGLVADCFSTNVKVASLIDAALAGRSQYIVANGPALSDAIAAGELKLASRVGIIRLDELPPRRPGDRIRLDGLSGVVGRADRLVEFDPKYEPVVRHFLSGTWMVDTLTTALGLRRLSGAGLRFVTAKGELLENDGTVVAGPASAEVALVNRRSQLNEAENEVAHYQQQIQSVTTLSKEASAALADKTASLGRAETEHRKWVTEQAAAKANAKHATHQNDQILAFVSELNTEVATAESSRKMALARIEQIDQEVASTRHQVENVEAELADVEECLSENATALLAAGTDVTETAAELREATSIIDRLDQNLLKTKADLERLEQSRINTTKKVSEQNDRRQQVILRRLNAANHLAIHCEARDRCDADIEDAKSQVAQIRHQHADLIRESETSIRQSSQAGEQVGQLSSEMEASTLKRQSVATRLMEDYEVDLHSEEVPESFEMPEDVDGLRREIETMRSTVQRSGNVNMEALAELEDLQSRYDLLHGQYQDLTAAKDSLRRVIGKINADSRRLFLDTLEAIRENFRELYRKSFGGGQADLILEDCDDPHEAGVEIVATPPGKPSFSNTLLSGGEKALTAVALLMSIFKYRPSPFCVLDEVDAPFDEANIGRFVTVLNEFLDHSKFVIVTHSKKTMTSATTLYGVTMQESGVSKQVSIRFEDVSEDGQISAA